MHFKRSNGRCSVHPGQKTAQARAGRRRSRLPSVSSALLVFAQLSLPALSLQSRPIPRATKRTVQNVKPVRGATQRQGDPAARPGVRRGIAAEQRFASCGARPLWGSRPPWPPSWKQDFRGCVIAPHGRGEARAPHPSSDWSPAAEPWPGRRRRGAVGPAARSRRTRSCSTCRPRCWASSALSWTAATANWAGAAWRSDFQAPGWMFVTLKNM